MKMGHLIIGFFVCTIILNIPTASAETCTTPRIDSDADTYCDDTEASAGSNPQTGASTPSTDDDGNNCTNLQSSGVPGFQTFTGAFGQVVAAQACSGSPGSCNKTGNMAGICYADPPSPVVQYPGASVQGYCVSTIQPVCAAHFGANYQTWVWDAHCGDVLRQEAAAPSGLTTAIYAHCKGTRSNYNLNWTIYTGTFTDGPNGFTDGYGWRLMSNTTQPTELTVNVPTPCDSQSGVYYTPAQIANYIGALNNDGDNIPEVAVCTVATTIHTDGTVTTEAPVFVANIGDPDDNNFENPVPFPTVATITLGGALVEFHPDGTDAMWSQGFSTWFCVVHSLNTVRSPAYVRHPDNTLEPVAIGDDGCGSIFFTDAGQYRLNFTGTAGGIGQTAHDHKVYFYVHPIASQNAISITQWPTLNSQLTGTLNNINSGTVALAGNLSVDSLTRLCAASLHGTTCSPAQIDVLDRLCASSAFALSCTTPTLNVAQSGTWAMGITGSLTLSGTTHTVIDSWPSLTAAVTNSGSLNVVNSGSQSFSITSWPGLNVANSGTLAVTNSGGQTIAVSSWPQLQAVLSGGIAVHQDQACGATIHCLSNATTVIAGNVSTITNALAFDWNAFVVHWAPLALAITLMVAFYIRRDAILGVMAIPLLLYVAVSLLTGMAVITGVVLVILYAAAILMFGYKSGGLKAL